MNKHNTGQKGAPIPNKTGVNQPGHGKTASSGHKMYMVNSQGHMTTGPGKTGAANNGVSKAGVTGQPSGVGLKRRAG